MLKPIPPALLLLSVSLWGASPLVDKVETTGFVQIEAKSFGSLSPKQQALAYWLQQSSIAIDPIIYDQMSRFGLRQKRVLEAVVANKRINPRSIRWPMARSLISRSSSGPARATTMN